MKVGRWTTYSGSPGWASSRPRTTSRSRAGAGSPRRGRSWPSSRSGRRPPGTSPGWGGFGSRLGCRNSRPRGLRYEREDRGDHSGVRVLDLFSGIGGFALGLESVGFTTVGFCEIEPFPRAVLAKHWPHVPIHDDVRTLSAESVSWLRAEAARGIDLICGGFPCQDISVAGKGAGLAGARSGLWSECSRLVGELRPRWALFENVGALKQRGIDRVCSDLEGHGYAVWPLLVGAGVGVGAHHRRDRVWIVAHRKGERCGCRENAGREGEASLPLGNLRRESPRCCASASELDNSDVGRRGREDNPVQAGRHEPVGADDRPLGDTDPAGLEGRGQPYRPIAASGLRWPARPGEPQHDWEEPRLADSRYWSDWAQRRSRPSRGAVAGCDESGSAQQPLGFDSHGLPERLVRLARRGNREALKAYGNSVVPAVVALIGKAILEADRGQR